MLSWLPLPPRQIHKIYEMIDILRLILDVGILLVLLMLRYVIAPSFQWLEGEQLKSWSINIHDKMLTFISPLHALHLIIIGLQLYLNQNIYTMTSMSLVVIGWITGMAIMAPKLRNVSLTGDFTKKNRSLLGTFLIFRLALQTVMALWSLLYVFEKLQHLF